MDAKKRRAQQWEPKVRRSGFFLSTFYVLRFLRSNMLAEFIPIRLLRSSQRLTDDPDSRDGRAQMSLRSTGALPRCSGFRYAQLAYGTVQKTRHDLRKLFV